MRKHDARESFDSCGLPWFGEVLNGESNENSHIPTGIAFYGYKSNVGKLDLTELDDFNGLRCLAVFDGQRLADDAWANIAKCESLRALVVPTANLDDKMIEELTKLTHLIALDISMTEITDKSISTLATFKNLRVLNVSGTRMTLRGAEILRAKLPKCHIALTRWPYGERSPSNWSNEVSASNDG